MVFAKESEQVSDPVGRVYHRRRSREIGSVPILRLRVVPVLRSWMRELWSDKGALVGVLFLACLVTVAVFAPFFAPHEPAMQSLADRLQPPAWQDGGSWTHALGTDGLGRDVLSRLIYGARVSLLVGTLVVLIAGSIGTTLGLIAGYKGGRIDNFIMRLVDTQFAFPGLLLALTLLAVIGASLSSVVIVLSIQAWMVFARLTRGTVLSLRETPYVEAAEVIGCRQRRVVFSHVLPNLASPLLTVAILEFARIILAEAALSFLGLGIQPPATSWGLEVSIGRGYIFNAWWLVTFPGIMIALTVLATNLVSGWMRVISDPQERDKRFSTSRAAAKIAAYGE